MDETAAEVILWFLDLAFLILACAVPWRIFRKMGRAGIEALIPLYNFIILCKYIWGSGWFCLLVLIPVFNSIFILVTLFKLYRGFGKGLLFSWLGLLFSPIALLLIAFDSSRWDCSFC